MNGWQQMVREFHSKYGCPVADKPVQIDELRQDLRYVLMSEELEETSIAMVDGDLVEIADGLADLIYVALGTAIEYGIDLDPVFREVHRSNMTKTPGNTRSDGKILKGPDFTPPDIASVLAKQT